ncbi:MAG TPA: glucosaminidase domain-containing protein [Chitinophagaceae bacterium]|nr:glucosaminidase domain-containing protein [Chitinophagaceae bacterium]
MQRLRSILLLFPLLACLAARSQSPEIIQEYIDTYKDIAIQEMIRTGVPASIKLAQGIHETTAGTSDLVRMSNNHFGIKCKANWTGESVSHDDDARGECFRKYGQAADSYRDHSDFLKNSSRYSSLFTLDPIDYRGWAFGLKKAGYATNPRYPQIIIKLIEDYHLQDYTLIALGKLPNKENGLASTTARDPGQAAPAMITTEEPADSEEESTPYPIGEFRINDTRVVYVKKETPLLVIAQQYHVPLARIFEFNDMKEIESLSRDQLIYLQRKKKTGNTQFHIVKDGETVEDIARVEAIRLESLLEYNQLQGFMQPLAGEQLYLRSKSPTMPKLVKKSMGNVVE